MERTTRVSNLTDSLGITEAGIKVFEDIVSNMQ
jgi:hypothetical protein